MTIAVKVRAFAISTKHFSQEFTSSVGRCVFSNNSTKRRMTVVHD